MADLSARANFDVTATDKTQAAFAAVHGGLDKLSSKATSLAQGGLAALAGALSVGAFAGAIKGAIDFADELNDMSKKTGVAVETLGGLGYAGKTAGVDLETIAKAGQKLAVNMAEAVSGNTKAMASFEALGITVTKADGSLRSMDDVLFEVADQFEGYADGPEKAARAQELFGKSGAALIPLLDEGGAKLREMVADWQKYGGVTADTAARADQFNDTLEKLHLMSGAFMRTLAATLLPTLQAIADIFVEAKEKGGGFTQVVDGIVAVVKVAAVGIMLFVETIRSVGIVIGGLVAGIASGFQRNAEINKEVNADLAANWDKTTANISKVWNAAATDVQDKAETKIKPAMKVSSDAADKFGKAMEDAKKQVIDANLALDEASDVTGQKLTPAMKKLAEIEGGPEWAKFTAAQREQLTAQYEAADATLKHAEQLKNFSKTQDDVNKLLLDSAIALTDAGRAAENQTTPAMKKLQELQASPTWGKFTETQRDQIVAILGEADANQKATAAMKAYHDQIKDVIKAEQELWNEEAKRQEQATKSLGDFQHVNDDMQREIDLIGATDIEREKAIALREKEAAVARAASADEVDLIEEIYQKRLRLIDTKSVRQAEYDGWRQLWSDIGSATESFIVDFVDHGSSAFKNLWDNFKHWALEALAKIAAQQIVVSLGAGVGGIASSAANAAAGGAGGNLLGLASNANSAYNLFSGGGVLGGIGSAFSAGYAGASSAAITYGAGAAAEVGSAAAGAVGSGGIIAGLEAGLAAVPVVGWVALAGLVIAGIISGMDDGPAMRSASFGSNGGLAAGNPLFRSSSNLGSFGIFNDSWFSDKDQGPQIQQFLAGIQSIDNALAGLVDAPTLQRIKDGLAAATTTFEAGMEHEATSFGEILQQRYHTVVEAIDPELTHLVDSFQGTGAELGKFVIDVVAVHETLKTFNQADLFGQLVSVDDIIHLQHAGESVSQTFTRVVQEFSLTNAIATAMGQNVATAFGDVGLASEGARADLIKLMGGMDSAAAAFQNYLQVAFTDTERQARSAAVATNTLNAVFGDLHQTVPQTWADLNAYIDALDLSTEAGRAAYAVIMTQVRARDGRLARHCAGCGGGDQQPGQRQYERRQHVEPGGLRRATSSIR
jgi:hypothetical protein